MTWMSQREKAEAHFPVGKEIEAIDARDGRHKQAVVTGYYHEVGDGSPRPHGILVRFPDGDTQELPFEMTGW